MTDFQSQSASSVEGGNAVASAKDLALLLDVNGDGIFIVLHRVRFRYDDIFVGKIRAELEALNLIAEKALNFSNKPNNGEVSWDFYVFAVQSKAIERCRDKLKKLFFDYYLMQTPTVEMFRLSDYLDFVSPPKKKEKEIIEHTFVHGIGRFYRFLFDSRKLPKNIALLRHFLEELPQNCPNHLFLSGPKASKGDWDFSVTTQKLESSDLIDLAQAGSQVRLMKRAHENIEKYLMLHDPKTFACEVPIWLQPSDFQDFEARFGTTSCITGHIDILRIEDNGLLGLWDYKPKASLETTAANQVWFYMMMLSKRTGVPMDKITGGYFDEVDAFLVHPPKKECNIPSIFT